MTKKSIPVSRLVAAWLAAAIILAVGTIAFVASEGGGAVDTVGASTYSRSAIGYAGIADVMRRLGARVVKSRSDSIAKLDPKGVLVVAEPSANVAPQLMSTLLNANAVLLVLPKWTGEASRSRPEWIGTVEAVPEGVARSAAQIAGIEIVRVPTAPPWSRNEIDRVPVFSDEVQLVRSSRLRPVVGGERGMLVGELRNGSRRLWVLADPDVMQNHGLANPANATFSVAMIDALRGGEGNVVFDEVVHGFQDRLNSPFKLLFEFPFVVATMQGAVAIALLLWATMRRFGAPMAPPVALQAGKRSLIETTAKLLDIARHRPIIIQRYVHAIVQDVARQLHAPGGMSEAAMVEWLRRTGRARAVEIDCGAVLRSADDLAASGHGGGTAQAALARDIFRWKREVIDGAREYSRQARSNSRRGGQGGGGSG